MHVERRGVRRQIEALRIQELRGDRDLVRLVRADLRTACPQPVHRGAAQRVEKHLHAAHPVEVVVDLLDGVVGRDAVEELQVPIDVFTEAGVLIDFSSFLLTSAAAYCPIDRADDQGDNLPVSPVSSLISFS